MVTRASSRLTNSCSENHSKLPAVQDFGDQIFGVTDALAERVRQIGCSRLILTEEIPIHQPVPNEPDRPAKPNGKGKVHVKQEKDFSSLSLLVEQAHGAKGR